MCVFSIGWGSVSQACVYSAWDGAVWAKHVCIQHGMGQCGPSMCVFSMSQEQGGPNVYVTVAGWA